MATGQTQRGHVQDPNQLQQGNAPRQMLAVPGIVAPQGPRQQDTTDLQGSLSALAEIGSAQDLKNMNAAFLEGQMAAMTGQTQEQVAALGNRTSMAGFVQVQLANQVTQWEQQQAAAIPGQAYATAPEEYQATMAYGVSSLMTDLGVGDDEFASEAFASAVAPTLQRLGAQQAQVHAQYTLTETTNAYTNQLLSYTSPNQSYSIPTQGPGGAIGGLPRPVDGNYRPFAEGITDQIIQIESGGDPLAQADTSSASGLGQFTEATWIETIRRYRPDLANRPRQELLDLRFDPTLSREMTTALTAQNASGLASRNLPVTPGTTYLAHFAGLGGASRVLSGDPAAPVSSTLTPAQIEANSSIMYDDGRMITNAELVAWAEEKMGGSAASAVPMPQMDPSMEPFDLSTVLTGGAATRDDSISGMQANFRAPLSAMFSAMPPEIRSQVTIHSGFRSNELQAVLFANAVERYGSEEAARRWVAPPGGSQHNHGTSADLTYGNDAAREWVHENAGRFGLHFRMDWEPWHIELDPNAPRNAATPDPAAASLIFTNPGLPPDVHRNAVAQAIVQGLQNDDPTLFQAAGGLSGLSGLNLSIGQVGAIQGAQNQFTQRRQNDFNLNYLRQRDQLIEDAGTGNFSEEEIFERLDILQSTYNTSPQNAVRMYESVRDAMGGAEAAAAAGVWIEPENMHQLVELQQSILDGNMTVEDAMAEVVAIGEMNGASPEDTSRAVGSVLDAYERVREAERRAVTDAAEAGARVRETQAEAESLISQGILDQGSPEVRQAGIARLEETLVEELQAGGAEGEELTSAANASMAQALVNNNVVDDRRAAMMRAAFQNPIGPDGEVTEAAASAFAFFLDLKQGANASPEYLTRMFAGNESTLEMLLTAEEHMIGDADMLQAIQRAHQQITDPVTQERIAQADRLIENGTYVQRVQETLIERSGLANTNWNRIMNLFDPDWQANRLDEEGAQRIMDDSGLSLVIQQETRSATALYPQASDETIANIVVGQMGERGAVMGSSFVMAPPDTSLRDIMGLNSTESTAPNAAIVAYVREHGEEMFGSAVWEDLGRDGGVFGTGYARYMQDLMTPGSSRASFRPEFVVELVGENLIVTPASERYAFDDDLIWDDFASFPEAQSAVIPAAEVGEFYNSYQLSSGPGVAGTVVNAFRPAPYTSVTDMGLTPTPEEEQGRSFEEIFGETNDMLFPDAAPLDLTDPAIQDTVLSDGRTLAEHLADNN